MKARDLIEELSKFDPDKTVCCNSDGEVYYPISVSLSKYTDRDGTVVEEISIDSIYPEFLEDE